MGVDDHAINSLRVFYDVAYEELKKEWKSNQYEKLSDCPSFKGVYTYRDALDVLIKGPGSIDVYKSERLQGIIDEDLELETLSKKK